MTRNPGKPAQPRARTRHRRIRGQGGHQQHRTAIRFLLMIFPRSRSKKALSRQAGYPTKPTTASTVIRPCSVNAGRLAFSIPRVVQRNTMVWITPCFRGNMKASADQQSQTNIPEGPLGMRRTEARFSPNPDMVVFLTHADSPPQPVPWPISALPVETARKMKSGHGIRLYEWCPILSRVPLHWHHSLTTRVSTIRPNGITNPTTDRQD